MKDKHQLTRRNVIKTIVATVTVAASAKAVALAGENQKEEKETMDTHVIVNFEVKSKKLTEFSKILEGVKTDLPKVKGCISVAIFKSSSVVNNFTLVETWETKELHQAHISNLSENGTWDIISAHLSKNPESDYFIQL